MLQPQLTGAHATSAVQTYFDLWTKQKRIPLAPVQVAWTVPIHAVAYCL